MKKILIGLGGLFMLLVAAVLIGPSLIDWNAYKGEIANAVETAIGRRLSIDGDLTFAVLPTPALSASGVRLANIEGAATSDLLTIKDVRIRVSISGLLQGRIAVEQVELIEPVIALEVLPDGRASWDIAMSPTGGAAETSSESSASTEAGVAISLASLTITDGVLSYRDGERLERLSGLNAEISAKSLNGPFVISASVLIHDMPINVTLRGGVVRPDQPIGLTVGVEVEGLDARASFRGKAINPGPEASLVGKLSVEGGDAAAVAKRLAGAVMPPILARQFSINGDLNASATAIALNGVEINLGVVAATGAVNVVMGDVPNIGAALAMTKFDLDAFYRRPKRRQKPQPRPLPPRKQGLKTSPMQRIALRLSCRNI
ncbi:MAG: AsmA family protein [Alphaproteobacteria bacterium]|nr:AsmA family protein [Alphaproteobacteria bacterium]